MGEYLGCDNKYGRPIPYVWFIIIAVSSIPLFLTGIILDTFDCDEIFADIDPEEYLADKNITVEEGKTKCVETTSVAEWGGRIFSGLMFITLIWHLKPWPISGPNETEIDEDEYNKGETDTINADVSSKSPLGMDDDSKSPV
jgi:hypothetical protein